MEKKLLYIASTMGHLKSFHLPYIHALEEAGWIVHTAGRMGDKPLPGIETQIDVPFEKSMFSPRNLAVVCQLVRLLRQERYSAISVHTSLAAFFTRLAVMLSGRRGETMVINTVHGYLFDKRTAWLKRTILLWAEKLTAGSTDVILTMNRQDTEIARQHHLSRGEVVEIPGMGVDFDRFYPANAAMRLKAREDFGLEREAFVLVYAAEFSRRKNQTALIRALAKLPERVVLLLAGRGDMLEECKALANEIGVGKRVVFAGFVPDVERCYHAADLCVSTSRSEGLPFNLMEAMRCGLPVAATQVKGHEDLVIPGETGELISFGDEAALCAVIAELAEHPERCLKLGEGGRKAVERYALEPVLRENMTLLSGYLHRAIPEEVPVGHL